MRFFITVLFAILQPSQLLADPNGTIEARPNVTDGDTYQFSVRLFGIDTPETRQVCASASGQFYYCGSGARDFQDDLFDVSESGRATETVACTFTGAVTYGRAVASCKVNGLDVGEQIIRAGWALAYREFLDGHPLEDKYLDAEADAESRKLGMWQGEFVTPSDWRNRGKRVSCSWN